MLAASHSVYVHATYAGTQGELSFVREFVDERDGLVAAEIREGIGCERLGVFVRSAVLLVDLILRERRLVGLTLDLETGVLVYYYDDENRDGGSRFGDGVILIYEFSSLGFLPVILCVENQVFLLFSLSLIGGFLVRNRRCATHIGHDISMAASGCLANKRE